VRGYATIMSGVGLPGGLHLDGDHEHSSVGPAQPASQPAGQAWHTAGPQSAQTHLLTRGSNNMDALTDVAGSSSAPNRKRRWKSHHTLQGQPYPVVPEDRAAADAALSKLEGCIPGSAAPQAAESSAAEHAGSDGPATGKFPSHEEGSNAASQPGGPLEQPHSVLSQATGGAKANPAASPHSAATVLSGSDNLSRHLKNCITLPPRSTSAVSSADPAQDGEWQVCCTTCDDALQTSCVPFGSQQP
jgi:hypothetical protein